MGGVLPYKWEAWEAHCRVSLSSKLRSQESTAIQMGAYCRTNWRCTAVLFGQVVGVGFPKHCPNPVNPYPLDSRERKLNTNFFFLKLFGHLRDIPAKSRDIPPKKFGFPGFEGTYRTFWPPPLHGGRPPLHRRVSGPKSLSLGSFFLA